MYNDLGVPLTNTLKAKASELKHAKTRDGSKPVMVDAKPDALALRLAKRDKLHSLEERKVGASLCVCVSMVV